MNGRGFSRTAGDDGGARLLGTVLVAADAAFVTSTGGVTTGVLISSTINVNKTTHSMSFGEITRDFRF